MKIEIHDAALEARIQRQIHATGSANAEEALLHLLDIQEEQDRWLQENKSANNAKIRRGIDQLERGEGIPENQVDSWLARMKSRPE
jgi:predicted transcriptional regulator